MIELRQRVFVVYLLYLQHFDLSVLLYPVVALSSLILSWSLWFQIASGIASLGMA